MKNDLYVLDEVSNINRDAQKHISLRKSFRSEKEDYVDSQFDFILIREIERDHDTQ